jgi:hypothetical protein
MAAFPRHTTNLTEPKVYKDNLATERAGTKILLDFFFLTGIKTNIITDSQQQRTIGDLIVETPRGKTTVELKIEERFTGNLFIETWSNREFGKPGWLYTSQSDSIVFYFRDQDKLFGMSLASLKNWLLNQRDGTLDQFPQVRVKRSGPNDTYGHIIPIDRIRDANLDRWWELSPLERLQQHAQAQAY